MCIVDLSVAIWRTNAQTHGKRRAPNTPLGSDGWQSLPLGQVTTMLTVYAKVSSYSLLLQDAWDCCLQTPPTETSPPLHTGSWDHSESVKTDYLTPAFLCPHSSFFSVWSLLTPSPPLVQAPVPSSEGRGSVIHRFFLFVLLFCETHPNSLESANSPIPCFSLPSAPLPRVTRHNHLSIIQI